MTMRETKPTDRLTVTLTRSDWSAILQACQRRAIYGLTSIEPVTDRLSVELEKAARMD